MKLIDMTVDNFVKEVDSNSPAPGGGSVAALASDIGAGLARMMAHLSFGKKKYEALDENIKEEFKTRFDNLGDIREKLNELVDEDTKEILTGILETTQRLNTYNCTKALLEQL